MFLLHVLSVIVLEVTITVFIVMSAKNNARIHIHFSDFHALVQLLLHQLLAYLVPGQRLEHRLGPSHGICGGKLNVLIWLEAHAAAAAAAAEQFCGGKEDDTCYGMLQLEATSKPNASTIHELEKSA
jgi:hypothetical protein